MPGCDDLVVRLGTGLGLLLVVVFVGSVFIRVSNRRGRRMQNEFVSVVSSRPTLGKIETTLQIGYAFGKVREKAILNHKPKYKKMAT